jgi:hypothetical protein
MSIYIIDSHRPYSLQNIFGSRQITVIDNHYILENISYLKLAFEGSKVDLFLFVFPLLIGLD